MKKRYWLAILAAMAVCLLCSCATQEYTIPEEGMVFDYYTSPIATVGDAIYDEITIDIDSDGQYYLNVYSGDRNEGTTTSQETYRTDKKVLTDVMEVVKKYNMRSWNDRNGISITGRRTVVKFMDKGDDMIRVTTENMPVLGEVAFDEVYSILSHYLASAEKVE